MDLEGSREGRSVRRRDPRSVGNGTAVSSPLTGAIVLPGSKWPFPSVLPEGLAPTSGTRQTPPNHALMLSGIRPCRRSLGTRNGINGIVCRSFRWKRVEAWPDCPGNDDLGAWRRRCYSCHHLLLLILFHPSLEGGGVSGNAWRRHPSHFFPYDNWDKAGPEDEIE